MIKFLSDDEKNLRNAPRRYGTHISKICPENIKCVGYMNGSFYVSEYEWKDFSGVMRDASWELTWIGNVGWFAHKEHQCVYEWLAARYDLTGFCNGEWILLDEWKPMMKPILNSKSEKAVYNPVIPT